MFVTFLVFYTILNKLTNLNTIIEQVIYASMNIASTNISRNTPIHKLEPKKWNFTNWSVCENSLSYSIADNYCFLIFVLDNYGYPSIQAFKWFKNVMVTCTRNTLYINKYIRWHIRFDQFFKCPNSLNEMITLNMYIDYQHKYF